MTAPGLVAKLDRRIKLLSQQPGEGPPLERISQLSALPHVVLLAEPGMGKSTVLEQLSTEAGGDFADVRWFIDGSPVSSERPLFLDSLDEYRSDSTSAVEKLTAKLIQWKASRWWLSCRAVDWRASDLTVLQRATAGRNILIATLEPLDINEADEIIAALTGRNPAETRDRTEALAARAFLQNPLSLSLLIKAGLISVPRSRFELFDAATEKLAHEYDERRLRDRAPLEILADAGKLCAFLLLSNRAGLWHQNRPINAAAGGARYLATNTLRLAARAVGLALDTALFQRNGEGVFAPMHRTIAEFLAGRALAEAVSGGKNQPQLPLARILALMTAGGRPPTDLRGVYAWTAVHLSRQGRSEEALRLIRQDPVSVLVYGDAAVLSPGERQELWRRLDQDDPWFLANQESDTAVGGLAGSDLVPEFERELRHPDGVTHRFFAVTEALRYGPPVAGLRPILYDIALDEGRADHERQRAAEAWLAGEVDPEAGRLTLFRTGSELPKSDGNTLFRLRIAGQLAPDALSDAELEQLLVDYAQTKEGAVSGRLWTISRKLEHSNRPTLLERNWHAELERQNLRGPTRELRRLLDQLLANALKASPAPDATSVERWLANLRPYASASAPDSVRTALQTWLSADAQRQIEFLAAIAEADKRASGAWPVSVYCFRTGLLPSIEVVIALLDPDSSITRRLGIDQCRAMAVDLSMTKGTNPAIPPMVLACVKAQDPTAGRDATIKLLENGRPKSAVEIEHEKYQADFAAERARRVGKVVSQFRRNAKALEDGSALALLGLSAQYRFGNDLEGAPIEPGFDRVIELLGKDLAIAVEKGWWKVAATLTLDAEELGRLEATLQTNCVELSVLAGIDQLLAADAGATRDLPLSAAIVAIKSSHAWAANDPTASQRLLRWGLDQLASAGSDGAAALSAFWTSALSHGTKSALSGSWVLHETADQGRFAAEALCEVLSKFPGMHCDALSQLLHTAAAILPRNQLLSLAHAALESASTGKENQDLWLCVAFAHNPNAYRQRFGVAFSGRAENLSDHYNLISRLSEGYFTQRILIAKGVLEACARGERDIYRGGNAARACLDFIQNNADPLARTALELLATDPALGDPWRDDFRHALATQERQARDRAFVPPEPAAIEDALSGGAPVNAADLFAVVVEQLRYIQAGVQSDPLNGWDSYWSEKPRTPKTENRCRDALARELQARLRHFGIDVPLQPEAQRAAETRADLLFLSNKGWNLPLEAKRHWHQDVWKAASTQLQGYSADVGADRFGIYVVFWFGSYKPVTARRGRRKPSTAVEMEQMLRSDLPENVASRTEIIVLDVSDPRAGRRSASKHKASTKKKVLR